MGTINLSSLLTAWYNSKAGITSSSSLSASASEASLASEILGGASSSSSTSSSSTSSSSTLSTAASRTAPTPPWELASSSSSSSLGASSTSTVTGYTPLSSQVTSLIDKLDAGTELINPSTAQLNTPGSNPNLTGDYRNLFALYQGLSSLKSLATAAQSKNLTTGQTQQLETAFQAGMSQVQSYLASDPFDGFQVYQTSPQTSETSTAVTPIGNGNYTTKTLYEGAPNGVVPAFQGNVQFSLTATRASGDQVTVNFNFADMGNEPRTMGNVLNYMNSQMQAAGLATRFGESYTAGSATTETVGSQTITLPAGPGQYALTIQGTTAEQISFSAPTTDPAVYVAQSSGITSAVAATGTTPDAVQQLITFDASSDPADAQAVNNEANTQTLNSNISKVVATATSSDGSVYVLADVTGTVNGQSIQGAQDVALIKYDSAGNVVFTQTLGATTSASATGLAVSADGSQVAVVGATNDNLTPGSGTGATSSSSSSTLGLSSTTPPAEGFVTVYDSSGNEEWTQQTSAMGGEGQGVQPSSVAFGQNGMVYVAGEVDGDILGSTGGQLAGGDQAYVQAFQATSVPVLGSPGTSQWVVTPTSTVQYGAPGQSQATGIAVSGSSVYVSSMENGDAVVRQFTATGTDGTGLTQSAMRNLGSLEGGNVAGVAVNSDGSVILAGSTHNGALDAGTVTQAYSGGEEAFIADLSSNLQPSSSETLTYLGDGTANQTASAVTVSGGQVYVAGQIATTPLAGAGETSAWNGYVAAVDPTTGQTTWSQEYPGQEDEASPTSIAVAQGGASVLDQLGLPTTVYSSPSQELVTNTSLLAGDKFYVQDGSQTPVAVTISATDTYQTLAQKIEAASNYSITATVMPGTGGDTLKLAPAFQGEQVSLLPGPAGQDALKPLGLSQGVLTSNAGNESAVAPISTEGAATQHNTLQNGYSLNLPSSANLSTPAKATAAGAEISLAMTTIQGIYTDMTTAPSVGNTSSSGTVPAYLTNEIASYQAALERLTGES